MRLQTSQTKPLPTSKAATSSISCSTTESWNTPGRSRPIPSGPIASASLFCGQFDSDVGVCVAPGSRFFEPDSGYSCPTISRGSLLRPYPQFGGINAKNWPRRGSSEYNSLLLRFEKRYSHGLNFVGHYTVSKYHSDTGSYIGWLGNSVDVQDPYDLSKEWSVDGADTPHRFVFGYSYELPVGRGRALGNNMNRILDKIVRGWQLNGVVNLQKRKSCQPVLV